MDSIVKLLYGIRSMFGRRKTEGLEVSWQQ